MARAAVLVLAVLVLPATAEAATLQQRLAADLRDSGPASGAHVLDLTSGRVLFSKRADVRRVMMSNTKLFTTGAALEAFGPRARFATDALSVAAMGPDGVLTGDLYLRGGGDPTFDAAAAADLVARLRAAGLARITGRVVGDGSLFDSELGPPGWQFNNTPPGPVGALQFNRGLVGEGFTPDPAAFAAEGVRTAMIAAGIPVDGPAATGRTPRDAVSLATVESPPVATLVRLINKPSDNLFAETIAKLLGRKTGGHATRKAGVAAALAFGRKLGVRVEIHTGSGAFPFARATPKQLVKALVGLRKRRIFRVLYDSLPISGRDGTLSDRMRNGPAEGRCHAKTGSNFSDERVDQVSVLSGYCRTRRRHLVVFSVMMNGVADVPAARRLQDHMVEAIVR
jgi:D-alanyl-D-alanine carboxypeptidase/D-alanyl-D-alanine-endopeptidase (penicillin-binding protein 4)